MRCDDRVNDALPSQGYARYLCPDHMGEPEKAHVATKPPSVSPPRHVTAAYLAD